MESSDELPFRRVSFFGTVCLTWPGLNEGYERVPLSTDEGQYIQPLGKRSHPPIRTTRDEKGSAVLGATVRTSGRAVRRRVGCDPV